MWRKRSKSIDSPILRCLVVIQTKRLQSSSAITLRLYIIHLVTSLYLLFIIIIIYFRILFVLWFIILQTTAYVVCLARDMRLLMLCTKSLKLTVYHSRLCCIFLFLTSLSFFDEQTWSHLEISSQKSQNMAFANLRLHKWENLTLITLIKFTHFTEVSVSIIQKQEVSTSDNSRTLHAH